MTDLKNVRFYHKILVLFLYFIICWDFFIEKTLRRYSLFFTKIKKFNFFSFFVKSIIKSIRFNIFLLRRKVVRFFYSLIILFSNNKIDFYILFQAILPFVLSFKSYSKYKYFLKNLKLISFFLYKKNLISHFVIYHIELFLLLKTIFNLIKKILRFYDVTKKFYFNCLYFLSCLDLFIAIYVFVQLVKNKYVYLPLFSHLVFSSINSPLGNQKFFGKKIFFSRLLQTKYLFDFGILKRKE